MYTIGACHGHLLKRRDNKHSVLSTIGRWLCKTLGGAGEGNLPYREEGQMEVRYIIRLVANGKKDRQKARKMDGWTDGWTD
jgi:hypothetical protein